VYGGAHLAASLETLLVPLPISPDLRNELALVIVIGLITYLSLVFGELLPKRIGMASPEKIAKVSAPIVNLIATICAPAVRFLEWSTEATLKLLPFRSNRTQEMTGEEIRYVIEQGAETGVLEDEEAEIMTKVFTLRDRSVRSVMTPRPSLVWLDAQKPIHELWEAAQSSRHTSLVVCDGEVDDVLGMVDVAAFASRLMKDSQFEIREIVWEPIRVPVTVPILTLLAKFRSVKRHVALVFDEYGSTKGIVTLHDLAEELFGELQSQGETGSPTIRARADGSFVADAAVSMGDLVAHLELSPEDLNLEEGTYHSLGGFILTSLGHIPKEGEMLERAGLIFEVLDMDRLRIDKVSIRRQSADTSSSAQ
jgi:putative hemolysin